MQELKDADTQATAVMEKWIDQSKNEHPFEHQLEPMTQYWENESIEDDNEEEELQSQEMARGQYMIDEDASNNSYHEHVQAATTPGNEEIDKEIFCEPSLEDPLEERFNQFGGDLDLDKLLYHVETFNEPSLEDPLRERFDQIGCDLDLDKFLKQAVIFSEPSLEDLLEECFAQSECDLDLDMFLKQTKSFNEPSLEDPL